MAVKYPQIDRLERLLRDHTVSVRRAGDPVDGLFPVILEVSGNMFQVFIDDEYNDYDQDHPRLCFFLVLNSLTDYKDAQDFIAWCHQNNLDVASSFWLDYYRGLGAKVAALEKSLGTIDPGISSLEYQLRSGAFRALTVKNRG